MTKQASSPEASRALLSSAIMSIVDHNRTIDWALNHFPQITQSPQAVDTLHGLARHFFSLRDALDRQLRKPLRNKDRQLYFLMLVGAYQLSYSHMPDHAVVNGCVNACDEIRRSWAKGLVNATLRQWTSPKRTFEHPDWLIGRFKADYGDRAGAMLFANNERAPMCLRVNLAITTLEEYADALHSAGIGFQHGPIPGSLVLDQARAAATLPGWQEGLVAVQDLGAQLVAHTFLQGVAAQQCTEMHLLDACAAPGGKLAHLYEALCQISDGQAADRPDPLRWHLTGLELSAQRLAQTRQILERLGHPVAPEGTGDIGHTLSLLRGDATTLDWWDGRPFDHILLDAPCSGTGTIRRHPDIKLLLQPETVRDQAQTQRQLLNNLWHTLAPGGTLWYCTCSLLEEENDTVMEQFLSAHADVAQREPVQMPRGQATRVGWQTLPTDAHTDGFYLCAVRKLASTGDAAT